MTRNHILLRRTGLAALGSAVALGLAGASAIDATAASAQTISAQQEVSQNWSGYVVGGSAGKAFSSVSGSWVQPAVSSTDTDQGYSAFWVGIGGAGQSSQSLEQVGTSAQVSGGQTSYSAWYELVPAAQVALPLTIHPGDRMTGRVSVEGTTVTIYLKDQTTGRSVSKTLQMTNPDTSSAEWIAEAPAAEYPDGSAQVLPLADFGKVTFTNASATAGGHTGPISDPAWTVARIDMNGDGTTQFAAAGGAQQSDGGAITGDVSGDGTAFTVSYSSGATSSTSAAGAGSAGGSGYGYPGYPGYGGYGYGGYGYGGYGYGYGSGYAYGYGSGYPAITVYADGS